MNWAFKVIQGHPYWCQHSAEIQTGCWRRPNVQQRRPYFGNLRTVRRHSNGKTAYSL